MHIIIYYVFFQVMTEKVGFPSTLSNLHYFFLSHKYFTKLILNNKCKSLLNIYIKYILNKSCEHLRLKF